MDTKDFKKGQLIGGKFGEGTGYGIFDHYIDDNKAAIHLSIVVADDKCLIDVDEWGCDCKAINGMEMLAFQSFLYDFGFEWDFENNKYIDLFAWRPKLGDFYFFIDKDFEVDKDIVRKGTDTKSLNFFKDRERAERYSKAFKKQITNHQFG